jgi:hypothetical protein
MTEQEPEGTDHQQTDAGGRAGRGPASHSGGQQDPGGDRPTPPYEGRRVQADLDDTGPQAADANVGGATGPRPAEPGLTSGDPEQTPGGATGSPADEQPAAEHGGGGQDDGTGPAHTPGVSKGEEQS